MAGILTNIPDPGINTTYTTPMATLQHSSNTTTTIATTKAGMDFTDAQPALGRNQDHAWEHEPEIGTVAHHINKLSHPPDTNILRESRAPDEVIVPEQGPQPVHATVPCELFGSGWEELTLRDPGNGQLVGRLLLNCSPWVYEEAGRRSTSAQVAQQRYRFKVEGVLDESRFLLVVKEDYNGRLSATLSKTDLTVEVRRQ